MNNSPGILHAFDPKMLKHHKNHDEVRFVYGRYLDIASQKGKDIHSLYFGTSKNSDLLAGIFLGDLELTSKVKDVSMVSKGNNIIITVKYIDDKGKLTTLKGKVPSSSYIDSISGLSDEILERLNVIDSSVRVITTRVNKLDTSVNALNTAIDETNEALNHVIDELNSGKYNAEYTVKYQEGSFQDGQSRQYILNKNDETAENSSTIEIYDYILKELEYNDQDNTLVARSWPKAVDQLQTTYIDGNGNEVTAELDPKYIQEVSINLNPLEQHISNYIIDESGIGDRLTIVENSLAWEDLFTSGD